MRLRQPLLQLASQLRASVQQRIQGAVHFGHTDKGPLVLAGDVLVVAEQHFVGRPVVARQIDHEALDHAVADVARFVELPHVEQVAGVLSIQRGHQLAGVQLVRCQNRQLELDAEQIAGLGAQRPPLDGQHAASEHDVDLDLHLAGVVLDDQLGVPQVLGANQACLHAQRCKARGDGGQLLVDGLQRFVARRLPREVHHVDVHRQARHVPHEEVDGRAALHGEDVVGEHVGRDGQQQANGVRVGLIHEVSGSARCRHRAGSSSACCCRCEPGTAPAGHRHPRGWSRAPR